MVYIYVPIMIIVLSASEDYHNFSTLDFSFIVTVNHNDFQIVEGNEQRKFSIDSTTGEVTVATKLDYDDPVRDRNVSYLNLLSLGRLIRSACRRQWCVVLCGVCGVSRY